MAAYEADWPRIRFVACLTVYGGALGAAAVLAALIGRSDILDVTRRLSLGSSLLFGTAGALAGIAVVAPLAYLLFGGRPRFYREKHKRKPRSLMTWTMLGLGFGVSLPFVAGAAFVPFSQSILSFLDGLTSVPSLVVTNFDLASGLWPALALFVGVRLLFSGLAAGLLFGAGSWLIDRLNLSADPKTAKYGSCAVAAALSISVILVLALGSENLLAGLG